MRTRTRKEFARKSWDSAQFRLDKSKQCRMNNQQAPFTGRVPVVDHWKCGGSTGGAGTRAVAPAFEPVGPGTGRFRSHGSAGPFGYLPQGGTLPVPQGRARNLRPDPALRCVVCPQDPGAILPVRAEARGNFGSMSTSLMGTAGYWKVQKKWEADPRPSCTRYEHLGTPCSLQLADPTSIGLRYMPLRSGCATPGPVSALQETGSLFLAATSSAPARTSSVTAPGLS